MRQTRALSVCLAVIVVVLAGCAKAATVSGPAWGTPADALKAGVDKLAEGFNFTGETDGPIRDEISRGTEIPGEDKLSTVSSDPAETAVTRYIRMGDELWMQYEGISGFPEEWGHLTSGGEVFASGAGIAGPGTWVPALVDEIAAVERIEARQYGGVLDLGAVDRQKTGIPSYLFDTLDNTGEVAFQITLAADGHIERFAYTLETEDGEIATAVDFTGYGSPDEVVPPTGEVTELTPTTIVEWLLGDLGE